MSVLFSGLLALPVVAEEAGWDERLARALSGRLTEVEAELEQVELKLPELPGLPVDDQGGTGGFASLHPQSVPRKPDEHAVSLKFAEEAQVEMVALVPSRRYEVDGLDPQFGMPDGFKVELLDAEGKVVKVIAKEHGLWGDPVRAGHPFVYELSVPVAASGMAARKLLLIAFGVGP